MADESKRITVKVSRQFHRQVRIRAAEHDVAISDIVRALLSLWLQGVIELPATAGQEQRA